MGETALAEPPSFGLRASEPVSEPRAQPGSGWNSTRTQPGSGWNQPPEPGSERVPYSRTQPGNGWNEPTEPAAVRSQPGSGWNEPEQTNNDWGWNTPQAPARTQPDSGWSQPSPSSDRWGWPASQTSYPTNARQSYPTDQASKVRPVAQPLQRNASPNATPADVPHTGLIILRNPSSTNTTLHYRIDGIEFRMLPGYKHVLPGSGTYVIEFHCGEPDRIKRYTLYAADYHFTPTDQGWELYRQKARAVRR